MGFFRALLAQQIRRREASLGVELDYCRDLLDVDPRALLALRGMQRLQAYSGGLSAMPRAVAGLVGALHEDCGPCIQIGVHAAMQAGLSRGQVEALIQSRTVGDEEIDLVAQFCWAVLQMRPEEATLRALVRRQLGARGLVAVAFSLVLGRFYPILKGALGYATCYSSVEIAGQAVPLGPAATDANSPELISPPRLTRAK